MATANFKKEVTINLQINEHEARYLLALTQNYIGQDAEDETEKDQEIRLGVFEALHTVIRECFL